MKMLYLTLPLTPSYTIVLYNRYQGLSRTPPAFAPDSRLVPLSAYDLDGWAKSVGVRIAEWPQHSLGCGDTGS